VAASPSAGISTPTVQTTVDPSPLELLLGAGSTEPGDGPAAASPSTASGDIGDGIASGAPAGPTLQASAAPASSGSSLLAAAGAADGADAGTSDKELDELARKLFPRLQNRLRTELLVDRERIGALVDFSH
jgi:hypothetical protein